jgi:hypothetical protein
MFRLFFCYYGDSIETNVTHIYVGYSYKIKSPKKYNLYQYSVLFQSLLGSFTNNVFLKTF